MLLSQVATAYQELGDTQTAAAIRSKLDAASAGPGIKLDQGTPLLSELRGNLPLPAEVTTAIIARQSAAAALAARWRTAAPSGRTELAQKLGEALETEDRVRADFYAGLTHLSLADRLALLHDQIAWTTIKHRAATGAYGVSLAPAWETQTESIRTELVRLYTELINGYGQQADTLPTADVGRARVELLRQGVLWSRLGLFPDHAEELLSKQLIDAARRALDPPGRRGVDHHRAGDRRATVLLPFRRGKHRDRRADKAVTARPGRSAGRRRANGCQASTEIV